MSSPHNHDDNNHDHRQEVPVDGDHLDDENVVYLPHSDSASTPDQIPAPRSGGPDDAADPAIDGELIDADEGDPDRAGHEPDRSIPVDGPDQSPHSRWLAAQSGRRSPLLPAWLRSREELVAQSKWAAGHVAHTSAYHGLRVPKYAGTLAVRSPRGFCRVVARTHQWVFDAEGKPLRAHAVSRTDAEQYLKLAKVRGERVRKRLTVAMIAALALLAVGLIVAWSGLLVQALGVLATVGLLGWVGAPADNPVLGRAVVTQKATKLTSDVVVRALASLGIAQISQAIAKGPGITFPSPIVRDGPGWRADIDLPYGVTVSDILARRAALASGLRRPMGCVWPEPAHEEHAGRLVLWVGDEDMAKARPRPWPLAKSGQADLFQPVPFGVDQRGRPIDVLLMFASILIGAMPRMGKTFALRVLLLACALDPTAQLRLFELKGTGDLSMLEHVAHHYGSGADDNTISAALDSLREVHKELERRASTIAELPREVCPENKVTRALANRRSLGLFPLVIAVDECQELFTHAEHGREAGELAEAIIRRGPAMGIILLLATQRPDSRSLPTGVSANVGVRFCLRVMGQVENDMVLGTSMYRNGVRATQFTSKDKGIGYLVGVADDPITARSAAIDAPAAEKVAARARLLREKAGTLTGHAAGKATSEGARAVSLIADVATVIHRDEPKIWSETVIDRLAELRPEIYGPWAEQDARAKGNQLAAALKPYGIETGQVHGRLPGGQTANRRGVAREDVLAAAHRARRRAREGHQE